MPVACIKKALCVLCFLGLAAQARAQDVTTTAASSGVAPLETKAKYAVLVEAETGDVLFSKDSDSAMPTSSMSKVMTMYLVFEAIRNGKLALNDEVEVSERAWRQEGSRMFINPGTKVKVEDLVRGVIVQSGNDASVALAEAVAGSEEQFAALMNAKAKELGMANANFRNATGLPDPEHYASPRDLATLALAMIRDFPELYHYYSEKEFIFNKIKQGNRNPLLYRNIGVDGLKTGHTTDAGFGLMASAARDGRRLVMVVNGLKNMQERADESARIIEWGYREFGLYPVLKKGAKIAEAGVWLGTAKTVAIHPAADATLGLSRAARDGLKVTVTYEAPVPAPVKAGQNVGQAVIEASGKETLVVPLVAAHDVPLVGFFDRVFLKLKHLLERL